MPKPHDYNLVSPHTIEDGVRVWRQRRAPNAPAVGLLPYVREAQQSIERRIDALPNVLSALRRMLVDIVESLFDLLENGWSEA